MIRRSLRQLVVAVVVVALWLVPMESFQDTSLPALISAKTGMDVAGPLLESGDAEGAAHAVEFASEAFATSLQAFRSQDPDLTNEVHIELLDLPLAIRSGDASAGAVESVSGKLGPYDVSMENPDAVVVSLLSVADEQYIMSLEGNEAAYLIAESLFAQSGEIFAGKADSNSMNDVEVLSFFVDLEAAVDRRADFVTVGNLVSAIQRDLLDIEAVAHDLDVLYENIRKLYADLIVAVEAGDYVAAEDLAIEAYLENFEYIEPALEKADAEFMYELEIDMREDLRDMIRNRLPPEVIIPYLEESILPDLETGQSMTSQYLIDEAAGTAAAFELETRERGDTTKDEQAEVRFEIDFIRATLQELLIHYEAGDYDSAYAASRTAYLDSYEYIEIPLRPIAPDFTLEVEYRFAELRNLIKERASYGEVRSVIADLERNLDESERLVTGSGDVAPAIAFVASFAIIFREGLESVLIIGAILTYMEASRNIRLKPYVYYGILAGIAATGVTWVVASYLIEISGADRELIEAIAALSATAVLFYVSFWILNKIEHKRWMEFVKAKVWQATTTGSAMVFVTLAFFTVYREGFETVLFYQAMFGFAKYMEAYVGLGFVVGMASLLLIYYVMRRLGKRLPLRVLFGLTMGIGSYLSIAFLGNAVRELQVLDIVPYTGMHGTIPRLDINMATMTGIYPTLETVVAQIMLLSVYLVASTYVLVLRPRKARRIAQMRKSRADEP